MRLRGLSQLQRTTTRSSWVSVAPAPASRGLPDRRSGPLPASVDTRTCPLLAATQRLWLLGCVRHARISAPAQEPLPASSAHGCKSCIPAEARYIGLRGRFGVQPARRAASAHESQRGASSVSPATAHARLPARGRRRRCSGEQKKCIRSATARPATRWPTARARCCGGHETRPGGCSARCRG